MNIAKLLSSLVLLSFASQASASPELDALWNQGNWAAAGAKAAEEKDFLTAASAMQHLQECPSPAQPNGQIWNAKIAAQGVTYARAALNAAQNRDDKVRAYVLLGNLLGEQADDLTKSGKNVSYLRDGLNMARQSKAAYETAVQLAPNDGVLTSTYGLWHARGYVRVGVVIGASLNEARHWIFVGQKAFNQMPEQTKAQVSDKAWTAVRLAVALESLKDKKMQAYFEAAIKLGEQMGTADGRCAANVARVHLGRPITTY